MRLIDLRTRLALIAARVGLRGGRRGYDVRGVRGAGDPEGLMITQEYTSPVSLLSEEEFAAFATAVRQIAALEQTKGRRATFKERVDRYAEATWVACRTRYYETYRTH